MKSKLKHLEFIQGVVNRFASDSFRFKGWSVVLAASMGNRFATDNGWEAAKCGGDTAIKRWIGGQMRYCFCTAVLVGVFTASRKRTDHNIVKSRQG